MAKKRGRRTQPKTLARKNEFFEAIPMATAFVPVMPIIPTGDIGAYPRAGLADMAELFARFGRLIWNRRSRALYLSFIATSLLGVVILATVAAGATMSLYSSDLSSPATILAKKKTGITLLDRNGVVLYRTAGSSSGTLTPLGELPKSFKDATLAAEDPTFYQHDGVSWKAMFRAAYVDVTNHGAVEGGSTLTQQLVKNALLTSTKTIERKYQELVLSTELEHRYSKDQILQMYVSEMPYGQSTFGVEAAAQTYFHKPAKDLDLAQSALLAGLPLGTDRFDPTAHPVAAKARRDYILDRMASLKLVAPAQAEAAKAEPIVATPRDTTILAPHFVFYVLDQLRALYGANATSSGMTVTTSLDIAKQDLAQATIQKQIASLSSHHVTNGGLVSLDPKNGDVLAMVGSVEYAQPDFGAVNVTLAQLQPGSSFKPFAYVTAFAKGWSGASVVDDARVTFPDGSGTPYTPQNYDGKFRGPVTLRQALSNSLNIPAIKVLQFATIPATIKTATDLGITTLTNPNAYGLSLVLGGGEVRPIDMASAYGAFATGGQKVTPRSILKVVDKLGLIVDQAPSTVAGTKVLDSRNAFMITNILSDNIARTMEFGPNSPLKLSRPAAAKTGTTNDFRDNWTVGYTPNLITAVWVGNNDHSPMANVDGITGAAPIWHAYMEAALADMPVLDFATPTGITLARVSRLGCLSAAGDNASIVEIFHTDALPTNHCAPPVPPPPPPSAPAPTPTPATGTDTSPPMLTPPLSTTAPGSPAPN